MAVREFAKVELLVFTRDLGHGRIDKVRVAMCTIYGKHVLTCDLASARYIDVNVTVLQ